MRQIKFRSWDNEDNKYFEPIFEAYKGNLLDLSIQLNGSILRRTLEMPAEHDSCFKGRYELEQFTGLTDKNGVDVYEHDICNIYESSQNSSKFEMIVFDKSVIRFYGSSFVYGYPCFGDGLANLFLGNMTSDYIEVIGNIHQNKDLLK